MLRLYPSVVSVTLYSQPDQSLMLSGKLGTDHLYRAGRLPFLDL